MAEAWPEHRPRRPAEPPVRCRLSGLEPLNIGPELLFVNVGERTNVTGSRRFRRSSRRDRYEDATGGGQAAGEEGAPRFST
jgi:5-methyltetrahydrofolate--homocysteine methyltransferase